jgi:WD40 repeat protein
VAAGFDDGTVAAWDADTATQRFAVSDDRDLAAIDVSADGDLVAISQFEEPVRILDDDGVTQQVVEVSDDFDAAALAFSPDRSLLAVAEAPHRRGAPGQIRIWDLERETVTQTLQTFPGYAINVEFDATGGRLVAALIDRAGLWDVDSARIVSQLRGHRGSVSSVAFDAGGSNVATASFDGTVRLWDADAGVYLLELSGHDARVESARFSADGTMLASAGADGIARVWAWTSVT